MCCRFLCYFCRTSRQNQRAMFEHLSYLLENSSMLLGKYLYTLDKQNHFYSMHEAKWICYTKQWVNRIIHWIMLYKSLTIFLPKYKFTDLSNLRSSMHWNSFHVSFRRGICEVWMELDVFFQVLIIIKIKLFFSSSFT